MIKDKGCYRLAQKRLKWAVLAWKYMKVHGSAWNPKDLATPTWSFGFFEVAVMEELWIHD